MGTAGRIVVIGLLDESLSWLTGAESCIRSRFQACSTLSLSFKAFGAFLRISVSAYVHSLSLSFTTCVSGVSQNCIFSDVARLSQQSEVEGCPIFNAYNLRLSIDKRKAVHLLNTLLLLSRCKSAPEIRQTVQHHWIWVHLLRWVIFLFFVSCKIWRLCVSIDTLFSSLQQFEQEIWGLFHQAYISSWSLSAESSKYGEWFPVSFHIWHTQCDVRLGT